MNNSVAIISDIHGNAHALREVLRDITDQGITERVCLADVVGYGGGVLGNASICSGSTSFNAPCYSTWTDSAITCFSSCYHQRG
jgi:hypothetical protein